MGAPLDARRRALLLTQLGVGIGLCSVIFAGLRLVGGGGVGAVLAGGFGALGGLGLAGYGVATLRRTPEPQPDLAQPVGKRRARYVGAVLGIAASWAVTVGLVLPALDGVGWAPRLLSFLVGTFGPAWAARAYLLRGNGSADVPLR